MHQEIITQPTTQQTQPTSSTNITPEQPLQPSILPLKHLKQHWLTIARPQYQRSCGISSLVSIWNYQFSRLGLGTREPICVQQAMLKLNLIGKGSIQESIRKKQTKKTQLTQKTQNIIPNQPPSTTQLAQKPIQLTQKTQNTPQVVQPKLISKAQPKDYSDKSLFQYVNSVQFGCFTGNQTLIRWYKLLCRIYGGVGRSYMFYKINSTSSYHKTQKNARQALLQGLNKPNNCFIYHAFDHYFCPVGYQFIPKQQPQSQTFNSQQLGEQGSQLYVMVGQSSKNFAPMHVFEWSQIQLDLETFWPKSFNIRRRKEGVKIKAGCQNSVPNTACFDCIMAFEKIRD